DQQVYEPDVVWRTGQPDVVSDDRRHQDHEDDARFREGDQVDDNATAVACERDDDRLGRDPGRVERGRGHCNGVREAGSDRGWPETDAPWLRSAWSMLAEEDADWLRSAPSTLPEKDAAWLRGA